jgi:major membrane immunogen (membrane-anchored lipoprotein)
MINRVILAFSAIMLVESPADGPYKDGIYSGSSRATYIEEPYYGFSKIVIENGQIIKAEFYVRDSAKHVYFNEEYEKYFAGNDEYMQQCRNDWIGINSYPDSLLKYQDLNKVDVISGATWSYDIFKASTWEALSGAEKEKEN